jgi:hypothetical protein
MRAPAYTPILRWKQAERLALRDIDSSDADVMLPLVEVVPKYVAGGNLTKLPKQMENSWPSGSFLASGLLSRESAVQEWCFGRTVVVPTSTLGCVSLEVEEVVETLLGGVGVGDDAARARSALAPGGVEQDGLLDTGQG